MIESKTQKVLRHLITRKSITSWEAIKLYRATRLSAIIYTLRKRGYIIESVPEYNKSTKTNFARYVLLKQRKKWFESLLKK